MFCSIVAGETPADVVFESDGLLGFLDRRPVFKGHVLLVPKAHHVTLPDLPAEFSKEPYVRGTVGMARAQDPNSANSQFFIMFAPAPSLQGDYTVVGNVESGMELVDRIKKGDPAQNGMVENPDSMIKVRIASDAAKK